MEIRELKDLIKNSSSVVVIENGEPLFVILDYKYYKNISEQKDTSIRQDNMVRSFKNKLDSKETEILEKLNKEILAIKNQIESEEKRHEEAIEKELF